ncbi:MerR family transcriptional regulator [Pigmentiphaga litoralis]|uniref:MerR family transcriptional regulator n=1 Tax=Pigmentiphaga litoralis TaxID=516702 RepID=UPI003B43851F
MTTFLSIAEAAAATGLTATTLRYYEQIGLIAPVERRSGARRYGDADLRWIEFLVRLRATGMSMRDMQRYAELLRQGPTPESVSERQALLEDHARRVEADLDTLTDTLARIRAKISGYAALKAPDAPGAADVPLCSPSRRSAA